MTPRPGERLCRFVGDRVEFGLGGRQGQQPPKGWRAFLRTNLGRGAALRREILEAHTRALAAAGSSWRDIPMRWDQNRWRVDLPLVETGYFKAKAYALDERGWQHWPDGPDVGISIHPDKYRTANILYCAFTRLLGPRDNPRKDLTAAEALLDQAGYSVLPPSGTLRELVRRLPHISDTLGCRILHLLPVHPTPTTYARFGRFGSPYAALDLRSVDPALVEFDQRSTGIDQFRELTYAAHSRGVAVFLDMVINHTGWGSVLQERHPEWFLRKPDGTFASPGAWGVTWEDLVELNHRNVALWDELSDIFLTSCERGVDGFRCDAGYMVPVPAWQYIIARVQQVYPETVFLLEGLGGAWETTEALLTEGGMHWAYSELFQNHSGSTVAGYLDHCLKQAPRLGLLVHYSETHDNERLAAKGRSWSLMRNRLCALSSISGGFGFTSGVEWLATEKIRVHERTSLNWGSPENLVAELARLNKLLGEHPCFFDGARLTRVSPPDSTAYALKRDSEEGLDHVLILVNTSPDSVASLNLKLEPPPSESDRPKDKLSSGAGTTPPSPDLKRQALPEGVVRFAQPVPPLSEWVDLLEQALPKLEQRPDQIVAFHLPPAAVYCLAPSVVPHGLSGDQYRRLKAQASWGLKAMGLVRSAESIPPVPWRELAVAVDRDPAGFLAALSAVGQGEFPADFWGRLRDLHTQDHFPQVVLWSLADLRRITVVPPGHWLLIQDTARFHARLRLEGFENPEIVESIPTSAGQLACFAPRDVPAEATLFLERYTERDGQVQAGLIFLPPQPSLAGSSNQYAPELLEPSDLVLLTNGRGAMARLCLDLGRVNSKYDCVLGANLHPSLPVDRHVLAKRIRLWINADGFLSPLDFRNLRSFSPGPPAIWRFVANAGDGRSVELEVSAGMIAGQNATVFRFGRTAEAQGCGKPLPESADVRLTVRIDIEDRNFHWETRRNGGAEYHFSTHTAAIPGFLQLTPATAPAPVEGMAEATSPYLAGFSFKPAADRGVTVLLDHGVYHPQPEWSENIPHPIEQSRGQTGSGDAFSPGWFEVPLAKGAEASLVVTAELTQSPQQMLEGARACSVGPASLGSKSSPQASFADRLLQALQAFVVTRGAGKTVIAGYPWFLDWGRDTFIAARGLLAAGLSEDVKELLVTFGRFERDGTLPNTIFGEDASNRDTSDAPLWFGLVCEEAKLDLTSISTGPQRNLRDVLESIAQGYIKGTPNGIRMDPGSALVWSPSHFTWMDTNYPACTPREGYPIEIQALWIRLLRHLARLSKPGERERWERLAAQASAAVQEFFWLQDKGYYADVLLARDRRPAREATADDALRSNALFLISLGISFGQRARQCVAAASRYLVVPGALRSLAALRVTVPLPNYSNSGGLLNDPNTPYWGRYEGDEDTRRKPAYHNGTAWTWTLPVFCEALVRAWDFAPAAVAAARAYLGSIERLMSKGCLGQIPEIIDGDAPHAQRGCDAQAWSATEALRVWKLLQ